MAKRSTGAMAKDWKDVLLRSGVPLEYDVARMLANEGFDVDADFPYMRRDVSGSKEHSVDLQATLFDEPTDDSLSATRLLVECKYRAPSKRLLLLPDPNARNGLGTLGGTIVAVDAFAPIYVDTAPIVRMERQLPFVYKGVELHDGDAVEGDLVRGIQQLRYGMPALVRAAVEFGVFGHPVDFHPMFFSKLLVTNAPILLLKQDIGVEAVRAAGNVDELGIPIDAAILVSGYGPDYERHFRKVFAEDHANLLGRAKSVRKHLKKAGKHLDEQSDPVSAMNKLLSGRSYEVRFLSSQFFICSIAGLPQLVRDIRAACKAAYEGRRQRRENSFS